MKNQAKSPRALDSRRLPRLLAVSQAPGKARRETPAGFRAPGKATGGTKSSKVFKYLGLPIKKHAKSMKIDENPWQKQGKSRNLDVSPIVARDLA